MAKQSIFRGFRVPKLHFLILLTLPILSYAETVRQKAARAGVLDGDILPKSYEIHIKPDYDTPLHEMTTFNGIVSIFLSVNATKTEPFFLNAAEGMDVQEVDLKISSGSGEWTTVNIAKPKQEKERLIITPSAALSVGTYQLNIIYKGELTPEDMVGFYKSNYTDDTGDTQYLLTTKFEPTHARKAFPCFDEPSFKATFKVSVDVLDDSWALSNTVVDDTDPADKDGQTTIHFKETPIMPTYLVAFIIYDKESFTRTHTIQLKSNVDITAWGPKGDIDQDHVLDFCQAVSKLSVEAYEEFTGIKYNNNSSMTKIDQVAIKSFASGAMENWGLITYRETSMYYSEEKDSESQKKSVAMVLAHELGHQWFGNLVTTHWWSNTWLNEGFARFFQYYVLDRAYPEWRMMEQLLVDRQQSIFESDAMESAEALTHDVDTFEEIRAQFGAMTYDKGASFLRMVYNVMGNENFQEAIRSYLNSRAYDNAEPSDLWSALQAQLHSDDIILPDPEVDENGQETRSALAVALETWTLQPGFPVLNAERNYDKRTVTFSQERFLLSGKGDNETKYWIPVTWSVKTNSSKTNTYILQNQDDVTVGDMGLIDEYIIVHSQGYYRVNYDSGNWLSLALKLIWGNKNTIEVVDRAQLVDDAFTLARAGYAEYKHVVTLLKYLVLEEDPLPWVAAFRGFTYLDRILAPTDTEQIFYSFIKSNIGLLYKEIGLRNGATHIHRVHQANIILWACRSGHANCLRDVTNLANDYFNDETTIKSHLLKNVLCYAIREKTETFWEKAYSRLGTNDRSAILSALTCTKDEARMKRLLNLDLSSSEVTALYSDLNSNSEGLNVALDYFSGNFEKISTSHPNAVDAILRSFGQCVTTKDNQEKMKKLFDRILEENADFDEKLVKEIEDAIKENMMWLEKYGDNALKAFNQEIPLPPSFTTTTTTTETAPKPGGGGGGQAIEPLPWLLMSALLAGFLRHAYSRSDQLMARPLL